MQSHQGTQWLSGRELDSRMKGSWLETHWKHCVVSLSMALYPMLSSSSIQEMSLHDSKIVDWEVKHQLKQTQPSSGPEVINFFHAQLG